MFRAALTLLPVLFVAACAQGPSMPLAGKYTGAALRMDANLTHREQSFAGNPGHTDQLPAVELTVVTVLSDFEITLVDGNQYNSRSFTPTGGDYTGSIGAQADVYTEDAHGFDSFSVDLTGPGVSPGATTAKTGYHMSSARGSTTLVGGALSIVMTGSVNRTFYGTEGEDFPANLFEEGTAQVTITAERIGDLD